MAGSGFGTNFRITTWGETHGAGVGVVVDGCPAGLPLEREDVQKYLDRRKPGQSKYTTQRKEGDQVEILSGIFEGRTTGTPISMVVYNKDQRSKDYSNIKDIYRPGHADFTFDMKYGFRDYRGGGRSSGRETIGRVAAGAVAAPMAPRAKQYVNISRYDLFKYLTIIGEKHIVTPVMTTTAKKLSPNAKAIGFAPTLLRKLVLNSHPIVNAMKANSIFTIIFNASTVFMAIMPSNPGINPNNPGPRSRPVNK